MANRWSYNRLNGEAVEWAKKNEMPKAEYCIRVKGGKKMAKSTVETVAGNGLYGFSMRKRRNAEEASITVGMDGQYKSGRGSVARRRKNVSRLASKEQIKLSMMDEFDKKKVQERDDFLQNIKLEREMALKKALRKSKRNPKARRGHK